MPRAHIVLAHPEPRSFNGHLAELARSTLQKYGWSVSVSDLAAMGFDPCEAPRHYTSRKNPSRFDAQAEQRHASDTGTIPVDVAGEIARLEAADLLILQFPLWWFGPPALMKGWLDRVFLYGAVYTSKMRYDAGRFIGQRAMLSVTCGAPETTLGHDGRTGDIQMLLWPIEKSLAYVGFTVLQPYVVGGVEGELRYSPDGEVARRLAAAEASWQHRLERIEDVPVIPFNKLADWDAAGRLKPEAPSHSPFIRHRP